MAHYVPITNTSMELKLRRRGTRSTNIFGDPLTSIAPNNTATL
jgi:hypothetical protein